MKKRAVVAGHICIDITPGIPCAASDRIQDILVPGRLLNVGDADIHTGGAVANTGLAMKILGADVTLVGKTGDDAFGDMVMSIADRYDASGGLIRSPGDSTSYSVVLAIPGIDRIFLHNPGANDTFCVEDLPMDVISDAALFHFGYPSLMKRMYQDDGEELVRMMRTVKDAGAATSLDLAATDPDTEAGKADWKLILTRVLPYVDIFAPSIEELIFMLDRDRYDMLRSSNPDSDLTKIVSIKEDVEPLGRACLEMGAGIVLIKCGEAGMFWCTGSKKRIEAMGTKADVDPDVWADRAGYEKSYRPEIVLSGTGAGDTSVAAFLTSLLNGDPPEDCVRYAAATGACCVEAYDALGGLKSFEELDRKIAAGWSKNDQL